MGGVGKRREGKQREKKKGKEGDREFEGAKEDKEEWETMHWREKKDMERKRERKREWERWKGEGGKK